MNDAPRDERGMKPEPALWINFPASRLPGGISSGGGERTRTADFHVANVALYQLSYTPKAVRLTLDEATPRLRGRLGDLRIAEDADASRKTIRARGSRRTIRARATEERRLRKRQL
jgi:hypothetical protein